MTGQPERPILFLDVDGTLVPIGGEARDWSSVQDAETVGEATDNPLLNRLDPDHGRRLLTLGCELVWATSWMDEANDEVGPRIGLPHLPIVAWSEYVDDTIPSRVHWKTPDLVSWAAGRTFIWVDDQITESDRAWTARHHAGEALLHRVEPSAGLTGPDFSTIEAWLTKQARLSTLNNDLARMVEQLLSELCVDLGSCLPPNERTRLCYATPLAPDAFADAVIIAGGMNPRLHHQLRRQLQKRVLDRWPEIVAAYRQEAS